MENAYTVLVTLLGALTGASAWRYYEKRAERKDKEEDFIKYDCKDRISKLETLLEQSSREKDEMRNQILKLVEEVASLRTEIKYLQNQK